MSKSVALTVDNRQLMTEVIRGILNRHVSEALDEITDKVLILKGLKAEDNGAAFRATTVQVNVDFNAMIDDRTSTSFVLRKQVFKIGRRGRLSVRTIGRG
jgi:hypothetical protein